MLISVLFPINAEAFTYLVPEEFESKVKVGLRVLAPFKRGKEVGIIQAIESMPQAISLKKISIKKIESVLDEEPLVLENLLKLINWVGQYYISTSGMALKTAIPLGVLEGKKGGKGIITYPAALKQIKEFILTPEQKKVLSEINTAQSGAFLLHGVTGSGKTEIYIRAIEALGDKQAIVLVPEIALTAQIIDRFRSRFHERVAFFHSGISLGEKIAQWWRIRDGDVKVVIGVRNAVFAPFRNLGLIVVDEEHEASYKQFEGLRYNARDVALIRARIEGIKIILGSATPSIETFYNAKKGNLKYLALNYRIEQKPLPDVEIIDMTKEDKKTVSFSNKFLNVLEENLARGYQALIMLNRRGYCPFLMCTECGYIFKCPACSISLTYHKDTKTLNCHYCNSHLKPQDLCPNCKGTKIRYVGLGTQRIEEELHEMIPTLSLKRMDRDTTRKKLSHYRIVKDMEEKKIDMLLGTQMVAKGHDFPDVTLACIVFADVTLNLPDFRSSERAFQLFTQFAGRAGRGETIGKVYIQTYEPEHYVFNYVRNHDYIGLYQKEIGLRKELSYPPFSKMIRIILSFRNKDVIENAIKDISEKLKTVIEKPSLSTSIEILGPAPAPIEKLRNLWRWHLILKGKNSKTLRHKALKISEAIKDIKGIKINVDVDPINLM